MLKIYRRVNKTTMARGKIRFLLKKRERINLQLYLKIKEITTRKKIRKSKHLHFKKNTMMTKVK